MMHRTIKLFLFLFVVTACDPGSNTTVSLDDEATLSLLFDIQTARSALEKALPENRDSLEVAYNRQIMRIHDLGESEFDQVKSNVASHPEMYDSIYARLSRQLDSLKKTINH